MSIRDFRTRLCTPDMLDLLRAGLIGEGVQIPGPGGPRALVYADYTASGRALRQVEDYVAENVLPYYANTHTESSFTGAYCTNLREEAREVIAEEVNAGQGCKVIFTGAGCTAAINRFVALSGLAELARDATCARSLKAILRGQKRPTLPVVIIGPYEHHSNILPWRESGAQVVEIAESPDGGPDMDQLDAVLRKLHKRSLVIGAFSAASNVTGILTDVDAVTRKLKQYGALACWDYASAGPYERIDMNTPGAEKDAVFVSPHKFVGGPGASGLLIVRESAVRAKRPTWPGGGSVLYVSPWAYDYAPGLCDREEAGTPNVIGDIRAALAFMVKSAVGVDEIARADRRLVDRAMAAWGQVPNLTVLAGHNTHRLPIFSLVIRDSSGAPVHHNMVTRLLSDRYGIQARGGCACAGPYGHRLLGLDAGAANAIREAVQKGDEMQRPGWTRLNLSYLMSEDTVAFIIAAVSDIARDCGSLSAGYEADPASAQFHPRNPVVA